MMSYQLVLDALRILHNFEFFPLRWREKEIFFLVRSLYKFWQFTQYEEKTRS